MEKNKYPVRKWDAEIEEVYQKQQARLFNEFKNKRGLTLEEAVKEYVLYLIFGKGAKNVQGK